MRKFLVALWAMLTIASSSFSQDFERPGLEKVEAMTRKFLSSADAAQLSFDGPKWAQAVESYLSMASDSAVVSFRPSGMTRLDLKGGEVAWCALWSNGGKGRLVWFAVSKMCEPEGGFADDALRRSAAYIDDVGDGDTTLIAKLFERDGLSGIAVRKHGDKDNDEPLFAVPDVRTRMALRIITGLSFADAEKDAAEKIVRSRLSKANETLGADLSGFPEMTFCDSPDERLRTVTYMVSYFDFTSHCGGWLVTRPKRGVPNVQALTDGTGKVGQPDQAQLTPKTWYGAIYSDIIQFEFNEKEYYALVGYKGSTPTVKTRVIDVLNVNDRGKAVFGPAKVFRHPKSSYRRRVFQYSAKSSMIIHYDENSQIIVMDHLEPAQRLMVGHPEFYGPDLSYDAYVLTDKGWEFQTDIQVTEEDGAIANEEDGPTAADEYEYPTDRRTVSVGSQQTQPVNTRKSSPSDRTGASSSSKSSSSKSSSAKATESRSSSKSDSKADSDSDIEYESESADESKPESKSESKSSGKSSSKSKSTASKSSSKSSSKSTASKSSAKSSNKSSWSGRSSRSSRRNKSSAIRSWLDQGKGNSAPNIRNRR